jgi:hypothetical protein
VLSCAPSAAAVWHCDRVRIMYGNNSVRHSVFCKRWAWPFVVENKLLFKKTVSRNPVQKYSVPKLLFRNAVSRNSFSKIRCPGTLAQKYCVPKVLFKNNVSRIPCSKNTVSSNSCSKILCPETPVQNSLVLLGAVGLAGLAKLTALPHLRDPEVFRPCHLPGLGQAYPTES